MEDSVGVSNVVAFTPRPPEFVGALLPLKGNQGRVAWKGKVSEARGEGPQVRI